MGKARREEIEDLDCYHSLVSHIDDLQKTEEYAMAREALDGYPHTPF